MEDNTAAFTYYYDPVILQNKLTPLSIFRESKFQKSLWFTSICSIGCKLTFQNDMDWNYIHFWIFWGMALHVFVLKPKFSKVLTFSISTQKH